MRIPLSRLVAVASCAVATASASAQIDCVERLTCTGAAALDSSGGQVDYSAGRAIVGSPGSTLDGRACIFENVSGNWVQVADIQHPMPTGMQDAFGEDVAIDGDWAVIGAPFEGSTSFFAPGGAYVFRRQATGMWVFFQELEPFGVTSPEDNFGISVSISEGFIAVAATNDDSAAPNAGAVYIYRFDGSTWLTEQKLLPTSGQSSTRFGLGLTVDAERVVVGAPFEDYGGFQHSGAVYIYERQGNTSWPQTLRLEAPDPGNNVFYGVCVDLAVDRLIVGAEGVPQAGFNSVGRAYIYGRAGTSNWPVVETLSPQVPSNDLTFGQQVTIGAPFAAVNARNDAAQGPASGSVSVYRADPMGGYGFDATYTSPNAAPFDNFGQGLGLDGGELLVGVPGDDSLGLPNAGAAYLFDLGLTDCNGNGLTDSCEIAAGTAPDVNGNGVIDDCEMSAGTVFCSPNAPNSYSPTGGRLGAVGSSSLAANNVLLVASDLPMQSFGLLLNAQTSAFVPMPGGSQGVLCLGGSIGRFNASVAATGPGHDLVFSLDNQSIPRPTGMTAAAVGERWYFQVWHRDLVGGMPTSNYTAGLWIQY